MGSSSGSEYCVSESISNRAGSTGKVGCRTITYLASSGTKSGSSSVKSKNGVSTNILSKFNHTHGGGYIRITCSGKTRIRLRFNLRKAKFYAVVCFTENISETSFCSNTEFKF